MSCKSPIGINKNVSFAECRASLLIDLTAKCRLSANIIRIALNHVLSDVRAQKVYLSKVTLELRQKASLLLIAVFVNHRVKNTLSKNCIEICLKHIFHAVQVFQYI